MILVGPQPEFELITEGIIMTKKLLTVLMLLGMLCTLSVITGCNTVAGAGKDVECRGEAIHDTAKDAQQKMQARCFTSVPA